jgi:hypothetical protein
MSLASTTISATPFSDYLTRCGYPTATNTEVAAWGSLSFGTGATAVAKVGLFGYDVSCLVEACAWASDSGVFCGLLDGVDGFSFGIHSEIKPADSTNKYYCVGFPDTEFGHKAACAWTGGDVFTFEAKQGYLITDKYFATNPLAPAAATLTKNYGGKFGLQEGIFESLSTSRIITSTLHKRDLWRFILPTENDGQRWMTGDTIDLFALDFKNNKLTDNAGFELLGAAHLTAVGASLIAAAMLV